MSGASTNVAAATGAPKAILVGVDFGGPSPFDSSLEELALLAVSAGDEPVARLTAKRRSPDAAFFVGSGKAEEIKQMVAETQAHGVIFDQALSPVQQRNLEQLLGVPVSDRTALILDIFADRAQSHEGKLQVELARLQYLATRLVRRWSHLERQRGGIGNRGGPGETQIELDRRMISERIKAVKVRLDKVKRQRATQSRARERQGTFRISLVGYTNAGKSTLFNALVKAKAYAADQLFATLDTTTRSLWLQETRCSIALSDTVGFIRDLPHKLVEAFQATLSEAVQADLLLHVVDASSPLLEEQMAEVDRVLQEIGADGVPQILVYNKVDRLDATAQPRVEWDVLEVGAGRVMKRVFVSARESIGLATLRQLIAESVDNQGTRTAHPAEDPRFASVSPFEASL